MPNRLEFSLNGKLINPVNRNEFNLDFSAGNLFEEQIYIFSPTTTLTLSNLIIGDPADCQIVKDWINANKGFEGIPLTVYDRETSQFIFGAGEAYCQISHADYEEVGYRGEQSNIDFRSPFITLPIKDKRQTFIDRAETLHLKLLQQRQVITQSDWRKVYYVLEDDNTSGVNGLKLILLSIQSYNLVKEFSNKVSELAIIALGAGNIPAGAVVSAAQLIVKIADLAFTLVALGTLIQLITDTAFDKARYHYGMTFKRIFELAAGFLGYTLETNLFDDPNAANLVFLPPQRSIGAYAGRSNPDGDGTPSMLFSEVLEYFCKIFNARAKVKGNSILQLYRIDYYLDQTSNVEIPLTRTDENLPYVQGFNLHELPANIYISYARDPSDNNTFSGRNYAAQSHTTPEVVDNEKFNTHIGLRRIDLNVSKGTRKNSQTVLERILNSIWDFLSRLGGNNNGLYGDRVGCLQISNHTFNVPKVLVVEESGFLSKENESYNDPERLLKENYLPTDSAMTNQQIVYKQEIRIPLKPTEIKALIDTPISFDSAGRKLLISNCQYDTSTDTYNLKIRILEQKLVALTETVTKGQ